MESNAPSKRFLLILNMDIAMFHLLKNARNKFKDLTKEVKWKFYSATKAYTIVEWENFMLIIDEENPAV